MFPTFTNEVQKQYKNGNYFKEYPCEEIRSYCKTCNKPVFPLKMNSRVYSKDYSDFWVKIPYCPFCIVEE